MMNKKKKKKINGQNKNSVKSLNISDSELKDLLNDPELDKLMHNKTSDIGKNKIEGMNFIDRIDYEIDLKNVIHEYRRASNYEMCVIKTNLKNIFYDYKFSDKFTRLGLLNKVVMDVNKIVTHTYNFLKIYILDLYEKKKELPVFSRDFIQIIMKTICILSNTKKEDKLPPQKGKPLKKENKNLQKDFIKLFEKYYRKTLTNIKVPFYDRLSYILNYEATDIVKNFENNISEHFIDYVNKYVNICYNLKDEFKRIDKLKKTREEKLVLKRAYRKKLYLIKKTILEQSTDYHDLLDKRDIKWIKKNKDIILPKKKFSKNSVYYDVKQKPMDYLFNLLNMNKKLEERKSDEKEEKLFNAIPLRTQIVPKQISIDTAGLISIFEKGEDYSNLLKKIEEKKKIIWKKYFKTHKNEFRRKNKIFHMISTDGVSCCIKFIRLNKKGELMRKIKNVEQKEDKYIENANNEELEEVNKKRLVTIDPNYDDIIYCVSEKTENNKEVHFRYTQKERKVRTKKDKYNMIRKFISKKEKIEGKSIIEIESELSNYNSKTNNLKKFLSYVKVKNKINDKLINHYGRYIFRKLKLNAFINIQKSESKMIKDFKEKYGSKEKCTVIIGDFEKDKNMAGKEPTINKKIRKIFRQKGYKTYLVNEFRTSKLCNNCECETKNYLERYSKKLGKNILVWGLICCTNSNCELIFNRDVNACKNMIKIVRSIIETGKRPVSYRRK